MSGISVICFGASYTIALVFELCRLFFRTTLFRFVTVGLVIAGIVAHTTYLAYKWRERSSDHVPQLDWYTSCLVLAWILMAAYLVLFALSRRSSAGLLFLPTSIVMIIVAHLFPSTAKAERIWNQVHGLSLAFGMSLVVIGFVTGLMYLFQSYRLKRKLPPNRALWMPSLERLQMTNERTLTASTILIACGLVSGILLNLTHRGSAAVIPWTDPVVVASLVWLLWLLVVIAFKNLYPPARQGRKVAYLTVGSFLCLSVVLAIIWGAPHAGERNGGDALSRQAGAIETDEVVCVLQQDEKEFA